MINIELTIDRIEEGKVVLLTQDQETIVWPKSKLPSNVKEGETLYFSIKGLQDKDETGNSQAKDILNEILNIEE